MRLQQQAARHRLETSSGSAALEELEATKAAAEKSQDKLSAARQQSLEEAEAQKKQLDADRGIYQMYAAATGIRWDYDAKGVAGYVALGKSKAFDMGHDVTLPGNNGQAADPRSKLGWLRSSGTRLRQHCHL